MAKMNESTAWILWAFPTLQGVARRQSGQHVHKLLTLGLTNPFLCHGQETKHGVWGMVIPVIPVIPLYFTLRNEWDDHALLGFLSPKSSL